MPAMLMGSNPSLAVLVGAMAVGLQRAAFESVLAFCRNPRGGTMPIGNRQSVADLLMDIKMRTETSRLDILP